MPEMQNRDIIGAFTKAETFGNQRSFNGNNGGEILGNHCIKLFYQNKIIFRPTYPVFFNSVTGNTPLFFFGLMIKSALMHFSAMSLCLLLPLENWPWLDSVQLGWPVLAHRG